MELLQILGILLSIGIFYYVYILLCQNGKTYTGFTQNLNERLKRHNMGGVPYTMNLRPVELKRIFKFE